LPPAGGPSVNIRSPAWTPADPTPAYTNPVPFDITLQSTTAPSEFICQVLWDNHYQSWADAREVSIPRKKKSWQWFLTTTQCEITAVKFSGKSCDPAVERQSFPGKNVDTKLKDRR
jgi:hypothetical protein